MHLVSIGVTEDSRTGQKGNALRFKIQTASFYLEILSHSYPSVFWKAHPSNGYDIRMLDWAARLPDGSVRKLNSRERARKHKETAVSLHINRRRKHNESRTATRTEEVDFIRMP